MDEAWHFKDETSKRKLHIMHCRSFTASLNIFMDPVHMLMLENMSEDKSMPPHWRFCLLNLSFECKRHTICRLERLVAVKKSSS